MSAFPKYNSQLSHLTISPVTTICHLDDWNCLSRMISSPSPSSLLIFLFCPFFYFLFMFLTFLPQGVFPCYSLCYSFECRFLPILSCPAASCLSHHCSDNSITYWNRGRKRRERRKRKKRKRKCTVKLSNVRVMPISTRTLSIFCRMDTTYEAALI